MAAVPTPYDATAGVKLTAVEFDAGVRDALAFLLTPPLCEAYNNAGIAVTSSPTLLTWDSETTDTDSMHSTVTNTSRITINTSGRYLIHFFLTYPSAPTGACAILALVNGASFRSFPFTNTAGYSRQQSFSFTRGFGSGDYLEFQAVVTPNLTTQAGQYATGVQAIWISSI